MPDRAFRAAARRWISEDLRVSRRVTLRALAATVGASLLSGCVSGQRKGGSSKPRVTVIGAGFSGLTCAYELASAGAEVTVLESRGRVGGRVVTLRDVLPSRTVEGGGEWIGTNHPHWMAYMEKFGLKLREASDATGRIRYFLGGKLLDEKESAEVEEGLAEIEKRLTEQAKDVNADEPWLSPNAAERDMLTIAGFIDRSEVSPLGKKMAHLLFSADNAVPSKLQSYLANLAMIKGGNLEAYWTDSEVGRCTGGNQLLAQKFLEGIGPERVRLNTSVKRIDGATVTLADGSKIEADEVVLTAPPSTWSKITIDDPRPGQWAVQMGRSVKYARAVKSRFWKEAALDQETHSENLVSESWDATDNQEGVEAVLANFVSAESADRLLAIDPASRDAAMSKELDLLFPGFSANATGKPVFMNWVQDPNTRASYSFAAPGAITTVNKSMHESPNHLHFAGEHTCPKFVGYMEGALDSGARVAKHIAKKLALV
ncbi:MAG: FAD-dependent oxidoreductase [Tepidisphaeraceae bacterium]